MKPSFTIGRAAASILATLTGTLLLLSACNHGAEPDDSGPPSIPPVIDGVVFEAGNWETDLPAGEKGRSLGNHRARVMLESGLTRAPAVRVHIPWRRHDANPEKKAIRVVDATSGAVLANAIAVRVTADSGDVVFAPNADSAVYFVYYFPYETSGGHYPKLHYVPPNVPPTGGAESAWLRKIGVDSADVSPESPAIKALPLARTLRIQSINEFHSFFPMEVVATAEEMDSLRADHPDDWLLFPEYREYPIRMRHHLPHHWAIRGPGNSFEATARRGEYFTFQIGVYAAATDLGDLSVSVGDFPEDVFPQDALTCFNTGDIDEFGEQFTKKLTVPKGSVQALWIGVDVPKRLRPGAYKGRVIVTPLGGPSKSVAVTLNVAPTEVNDHGDGDPARMSRLRWLNSTIGADPDFIIEPFVPVAVDVKASGNGARLSILGRSIELGANGLPSRILSRFTPEMTRTDGPDLDILAAPLDLRVTTAAGPVSFQFEPFRVTQNALSRAAWRVTGAADAFRLTVEGALEYDGMLSYRMNLVARRDVEVADIALPISYVPEAAKYILGLGLEGQERPASFDWKWKVENHQEGAWMGGINRGLQYVLRDDNYVRPLNTNFYQNQPLEMPPSWYNRGNGGIRIRTAEDLVTATNYSGPRHLDAGDTLHFNVRFLITPFKPLDTRTHFDRRFVHKYVPVDTVIAWCGTVVNIHHANEINPYINYPFFHLDEQTAYIEKAHVAGVKVKLYDTIRELTYHAYELFPLRSLGTEIFNDGEGGGHSWLQEHLQDHYHAAWHAYRVDDAAILDKGTSRWTNYYIEGLNWLAKNQHIDGLYLDDIAFDRETVKRMVSVLSAHRDEVVIDLHSANQYNPRDGFINSAMLYMEHFPYISRLWFGEYFDYDQGPDYWMTEVSGLPFGLMGEMLQGGGHPYRGMLYGMTTRFWGDTDPRPVWKMTTDFGIDESQMKGYWLDDTPVRTDNPRILATTYVRDDRTLIALGSWDDSDARVTLTIDWDALGLSPSTPLEAPAVAGIQEAQTFDAGSKVRVPANQGLYLVARAHGAPE